LEESVTAVASGAASAGQATATGSEGFRFLAGYAVLATLTGITFVPDFLTNLFKKNKNFLASWGKYRNLYHCELTPA
jgi:hypothetical protein